MSGRTPDHARTHLGVFYTLQAAAKVANVKVEDVASLVASGALPMRVDHRALIAAPDLVRALNKAALREARKTGTIAKHGREARTAARKAKDKGQ